MEVKLNLIERALMKLGSVLFDAGRKVREIVFKRYYKDLKYRSITYYPKDGVLTFKNMREERKETES